MKSKHTKLHAGLLALACLGAAALALGGVAYAAAAPANEIPWGDAVAEIAETAAPAVKDTLTILLMGVLLKFAGPFGMLVRQGYVSGLVDKAVDFAFGATAGAQRGKVLDVNTLPEFMRNVLLFANSNFPWVLRFVIKHTKALIEMALARIVNEVPADFRYTPALAAQVEAETGGVKRPNGLFGKLLGA